MARFAIPVTFALAIAVSSGHAATTIDFETPGLGNEREIPIHPYIASGVTFTSHDSCGRGALGLIRSAGSQALVTGPRGYRSQIGSGPHIRADLPSDGTEPIRAVRVDAMSPSATSPASVGLDLYGAAGTLIAASAADVAEGAAITLTAVADEPVAYAIIWGIVDVQCGAVDGCGYCFRGVAIDNFTFGDCLDTAPPRLSVTLLPSILWPPDRELVGVRATVGVVDDCDPTPIVTLTSIASDEPDVGTGPLDLPDDIQDAALGTADFDIRLRAERAGQGDGRSYRACYEARDASGNVTRECASVHVPHDRRGRTSLAPLTGSIDSAIVGPWGR